jgi:hypothetical protein
MTISFYYSVTLFLFSSQISGPNLRHLAPMTKMEISSQMTYHSMTKVSGVTSKSSQIATFLVVVALLTFALWTPCHLTWMPCHLPCGCPVGCHIAPHHLLCGCHVVATSSATMSVTTSSATSSSMSTANSSLQVMWQVNP